MAVFKGSGVALVTPFREGSVDYKKLGDLIEWHVKNSTDALVICGTTGESSTMSKEEKKQAIQFVVEQAAGRIPVIAGTGSNNTAEAIEMSKFAQSAGADALLVVTPYYNKTTQKGLAQHFTAIADVVNIPLILYNVPGRTAVNLAPETVKLLSNHKNICAIKEASGDISQVAEIARLVPEEFAIYSGNDDQIVPVLSLGGCGVISVLANLMPEETHDMVMEYLEGDTKKSLELQLKLNGLVKMLFIEPNPIPVKTAMNLCGMDVGELRLPLAEMDEANKEKLTREMQNVGIKVSI